jgi:hypothetical protein
MNAFVNDCVIMNERDKRTAAADIHEGRVGALYQSLELVATAFRAFVRVQQIDSQLYDFAVVLV